MNAHFKRMSYFDLSLLVTLFILIFFISCLAMLDILFRGDFLRVPFWGMVILLIIQGWVLPQLVSAWRSKSPSLD